jgi:hypothetical protein
MGHCRNRIDARLVNPGLILERIERDRFLNTELPD